MKMASRLAHHRKRPGFIPLPPPSPLASGSASGHAGPRSSGPTANTNTNTNNNNLNPQSPHSNPNPIPNRNNINTESIAIPPQLPAVSPYYSPSQLFPSATKSYFPAYLSAAHAQSPQPASSTPSPLSPDPHLHPHQTTTSSYFPSMSATANPTAVPSSPLSGKARPAATSTSSARASYHALLAQQQLAFQMQQRELIYQATRGAASASSGSAVAGAGGPLSPRLLPLGSPGPVTPLTLEDNPAGYLGLLSPTQVLQLQQHHLEKLAVASSLAASEQAEDPKSS
ncbi:hypothetical protein ABW21_db0205134 [Orbilia brochopaga]|nr:hypothetical protein ABW21_db0205134 [Drechslerella brochopaga]